MRTIAFWFIAVCLGIVALPRVRAQATCTDLVLSAVETLGSSCAEMGRNSVCYGNHRLGAVLTRPLSIEAFNAPSDQVRLTDLQSLTTSPLDLDLGTWGIAVMSLQANVPQALPGQVVTFLLLGDVEVENDAPVRGLVSATAAAATSLYSQPNTASTVLAPIDENATLGIAGATADNAWLRVLHEDQFGWVSRSAVASVLPQLPIVDENTPLPMQAFTFRAAVGGPRCAEAPPSLLVIQGPEQVRVSLTVNGARMDLGSTAVLWQPEEQALQLAVLDGQAEIEGGATIPAGSTSTVPLDNDGLVDGAWAVPRPLTVFEIAALLPLEQLPASVLNYPINVLEAGEATPTPNATPTRAIVPTRPAPRPTATPVPPTLTPAPQVSFTADSQIINIGECTTLRWFTQNIDSVYIDNAPTVGESSLQVCPQRTQTYVLLVRFRDGTQQTYSLTIQVSGPTSTPITPTPTCGNFVCEPGEDACICSEDCDGSCNIG